jgi:hypothetical protein
VSSRQRVRRYATKAEVDRAVQAVLANGIPVSSIVLGPDGTIALSSGRLPASAADRADGDEFETWDRAGRL